MRNYEYGSVKEALNRLEKIEEQAAKQIESNFINAQDKMYFAAKEFISQYDNKLEIRTQEYKTSNAMECAKRSRDRVEGECEEED